MLKKLSLIALLWALCLPCLAAPQDYVFTVRSGGAPVSGLATALTSSETAFNATSEAAVSSGLPAVHEFGSSGRYVVHYDAAANGPLLLMLDAGSGVSDPNERYTELHLVADPAITAASATAIAQLPTAAAIWSYSGRSLTVAPPTTGQITAGLMAYNLGHSLTFGQLQVLLQATLLGVVSNSWNLGTRTLSTSYTLLGDGSPLLTYPSVYPFSQTLPPGVVSRTATTGTVPQP